MSIDHINVQKANVHNLKSVSIKIPKNTLTVILPAHQVQENPP